METVTLDDLKQLAKTHTGPHVSLYLPTVKAGADTRQNATRFKNVVTEAKQLLETRGVDAKTIDKIVAPAADRLNDTFYWQQQAEGLAAFLGEDRADFFRLPVSFDEEVVADEHFYIKPLLRYFNGDGRYYVLILNLSKVALYLGSRYTMTEIDIPGEQLNLENILKYDLQEKQQQSHTRRPEQQGGRRAFFHGHGSGTDGINDKKEQASRFMHAVFDRIFPLLNLKSVPLVLIGQEYLLPIYEDASEEKAREIVRVPVNPERVLEKIDEKKILELVWPEVSPLFARIETETLDTFRDLSGSEKVSADLEEIVTAACNGRTEALFVKNGSRVWGRVDLQNQEVEVHENMEDRDVELLNTAVVETLLHGSEKVFHLSADRMPVPGAEAAAIFRY
ncbi:MAG: hypothetical protein ACLFRY_05425 [Spirochaetia bacterium]